MQSEIIKRPYITEKTLTAAAKGYYSFVVDMDANKAQIAGAIEKQYHVNVVCVRTAIAHGKVRRVGKKMMPVRKTNWKKAIVILRSGQKIDAFDVSQETEKK